MGRDDTRIVFYIIHRPILPCLHPKRKNRIVFREKTFSVEHALVGEFEMSIVFKQIQVTACINIFPTIIGMYGFIPDNRRTSVPLLVAHAPAAGYIGVLYAVDNKIDLVQIQTVDRVHKPGSLYAVHNGRRNILFLAESADRKYRK